MQLTLNNVLHALWVKFSTTETAMLHQIILMLPHAELHVPAAALWAIAQLAPSACQDGCSTLEAAIPAKPAVLFALTTTLTSASNAFPDTTSTQLQDAASAL
jgi:hypothetical protein